MHPKVVTDLKNDLYSPLKIHEKLDKGLGQPLQVFGHVYKQETVLWTLEKMIKFSLKELTFSGNMYFSYTERLASAEVEEVLWLQRNDKKVTLLPIYHISSV